MVKLFSMEIKGCTFCTVYKTLLKFFLRREDNVNESTRKMLKATYTELNGGIFLHQPKFNYMGLGMPHKCNIYNRKYWPEKDGIYLIEMDS